MNATIFLIQKLNSDFKISVAFLIGSDDGDTREREGFVVFIVFQMKSLFFDTRRVASWRETSKFAQRPALPASTASPLSRIGNPLTKNERTL